MHASVSNAVPSATREAEEARSAMHYVAPVGEKEDYVERAMRNITPFLAPVPAAA